MTESSQKLCPMCAEGIRGDETNCPHCGSALRPKKAAEEPTAEPKSAAAHPRGRKLGVIIGAAAVILVGGAVAGVALLRSGKSPEQPIGQASKDTSLAPAAKAAPTAEADATPEALKNASYHFPVMTDEEMTFALKDGKYEGEGGESLALAPSDNPIVADVDGDGFREVIGLLNYTGGGSMNWMVLVVVDGPDSTPKQRAATVFGDRDVIEGMRVDGDVISLKMIVHKENDPDCCPSRRTTQRLRLRGNELVEADAKKTATGAMDGVNASDILSSLPRPSDPVIDAAAARGHLKKGRLLEKDGQHDAAIAEYVEALRLSPSMSNPGKAGAVWGELGYALMNMERYDDAEAVCKLALEVGGDGKFRSSVNYNLGVIMKKNGRAQEAIHYFEISVAANPGNKVAAAKLAELRGN
jgi:hypothetical protein